MANGVNQPVLEQIARDIKTMDETIVNTEELIDAAREAGEDVAALSAELTRQKLRRDKWKDMLSRRGYM